MTLLVLSAFAQEPACAPLEGDELAARTDALTQRLSCPTCEGESLFDSETGGAEALFAEVEGRLASGWCEEQIEADWVERYGDAALSGEPAEEAPEDSPEQAPADPGVIVPPALVEGVTPDYPPEAREQNLTGNVLLLLTVDETGTVIGSDLLTSSGHTILDLAALDASWRLIFDPATLGGQPVGVQIQYRFAFDLSITDETGNPEPGSLRGAIVDPDGLAVPGAMVTVRPLDDVGETLRFNTDAEGLFRATFLPAGPYEVIVEYPGFETSLFVFEVADGEVLQRSFPIFPEGTFTIVVTDEATWREIERAPLEPNVAAQTGQYTLTRRDIEANPGSLEDVSRAVHSLPGIVSDGDMVATFNARGGETDDVVFLLDRVPLGNPFHLAGFNSLFNPDLISTVDFYAGTAPANEPAGTSAVLSVHTWDGSPRQDASDLDGAIDISASSMRVMMMGPINDTTSIAVAGRRSYLESYFQVMKWANVLDTAFAAPEFGELSARLSYRPNDAHRFMITMMRTGDSLNIVDSGDDSLITVDATFQLDNHLNLMSLDHTWQVNEGTQLRSTTAWTQDKAYMLRDLGGIYEQDIRSHRWFGRTDLSHQMGRHTAMLGGDLSYLMTRAKGSIEDNRLQPTWGNSALAEYDTQLVDLSGDLAWPEASAYVQDTWEGPVRVRVGGRATWSGLTDELLLSPRAGASIPLPTGTVPKVSWGIYQKIPHDPRFYDPASGNPDLKAERAVHYVVGLDQGFPLPVENAGGLLRVEAYRIDLSNLVVTPDTLSAVQSGVTYTNDGSGINRGVDTLLGARAGRFQGMATYSFLRAERTNPLHQELAKNYAPAQDQNHTLGVTLEYQLTPAWRVTGRYSYHTGRPTSTLTRTPSDTFMITGVNDYRLDRFHNVDARAEWRKAKDTYRLSVYVEVLNVANFKSDFVPIVAVVDGERNDSMLYHLPIRPFMGVRADF